MTVFLDGVETYDWPVSTGKAGYSTPSGTYTATSMNEIWYSKQWDNAPMPHSIFFMKDGHAIHGSNEVKNLGKPVSHGCVRISPENAATLYALVAENGLENTQVVLTGATPGGEFKSRGARQVRAGLFRALIWRSLLQPTAGLLSWSLLTLVKFELWHGPARTHRRRPKAEVLTLGDAAACLAANTGAVGHSLLSMRSPRTGRRSHAQIGETEAEARRANSRSRLLPVS